MLPLPPTSTLFPYTTLFRSRHGEAEIRLGPQRAARPDAVCPQGEKADVHVGVAAALRHAAQHLAHGLSRRHAAGHVRSEEHTSELQSQSNLVCRLLLEKKNK